MIYIYIYVDVSIVMGAPQNWCFFWWKMPFFDEWELEIPLFRKPPYISLSWCSSQSPASSCCRKSRKSSSNDLLCAVASSKIWRPKWSCQRGKHVKKHDLTGKKHGETIVELGKVWNSPKKHGMIWNLTITTSHEKLSKCVIYPRKFTKTNRGKWNHQWWTFDNVGKTMS